VKFLSVAQAANSQQSATDVIVALSNVLLSRRILAVTFYQHVVLSHKMIASKTGFTQGSRHAETAIGERENPPGRNQYEKCVRILRSDKNMP